MSLKIAFILTTFPALSETFILNQITGLLDLGHEVDIYSRNVPSKNAVHEDVKIYRLLDRTVYLDKVPKKKVFRAFKAIGLLAKNIHKNPLKLLSSFNVFAYGKEALSLNLFHCVNSFLGKRYDIIQCHYGQNGNLGVVLKTMKIGTGLVTMFHGWDIRSGIKNGAGIYRTLFKSADCLLANSRYTWDHLISFGADGKKIIFHPVGINIEKFDASAKSPKILDRNPIIILTIARLVEEKGLEYGIRAIRKLLIRKPTLSLKYYIVGEGPLRAPLENLVSKLGLTNIVQFRGGMVQEKVIQISKESHLFLLPSVEEAFGVALLEAQAMGIPVVATTVGGVSQAIDDGQSGFLVPPRDPKAIAERLNYLIEHPDIWHAMGKAGRQYVEAHYDIKALNRRLSEIYDKLLNSR